MGKKIFSKSFGHDDSDLKKPHTDDALTKDEHEVDALVRARSGAFSGNIGGASS